MNRHASRRADSFSIAGYPVRVLPLRFGDRRLELAVVDRLEEHVDAAALLRDAEAPEPPYWAHAWAGSRALARIIADVNCRGQRVVEIGCGLGVAGIVAALGGAAVTMFDTATTALHFARRSAELNRCRVSLLQTDVRSAGLRGHFDYCLAADVTYDSNLQAAVATFFAAHLARDGRAWCTESVRTLDERFQEACERYGLRVDTREVNEPDEPRDSRVRITEVSWSTAPGTDTGG